MFGVLCPGTNISFFSFLSTYDIPDIVFGKSSYNKKSHIFIDRYQKINRPY